MKLVDRHVERAFRTRADETLAFYPLGPCLRGSVIGLAEKMALRRVMRTFVVQQLWVVAISLGAAFVLILLRFHAGTTQGTAATEYQVLGIIVAIAMFGPLIA